jgi:hypothetical protein
MKRGNTMSDTPKPEKPTIKNFRFAVDPMRTRLTVRGVFAAAETWVDDPETGKRKAEGQKLSQRGTPMWEVNCKDSDNNDVRISVTSETKPSVQNGTAVACRDLRAECYVKRDGTIGVSYYGSDFVAVKTTFEELEESVTA